MSKKSIDWHKECQKNFAKTLAHEEELISSLKSNLEISVKRYNFKQDQLNEARKRGLKEFDDQKLLVKRNSQTVKEAKK